MGQGKNTYKETESMSGGFEDGGAKEPEEVKAIMELAKCDARTARDIIGFFSLRTQERFDKWRENFTGSYRKRQKDRADDIYQLTKRLKKSGTNKQIVEEIEKKLLDLVVNP